jgi:hypothetical protein
MDHLRNMKHLYAATNWQSLLDGPERASAIGLKIFRAKIPVSGMSLPCLGKAGSAV